MSVGPRSEIDFLLWGELGNEFLRLCISGSPGASSTSLGYLRLVIGSVQRESDIRDGYTGGDCP
jgi:hypothetical protein